VDVDVVLVCETPALVTRDPAKQLQPLRELRDWEGCLLGRFETEDEEVPPTV